MIRTQGSIRMQEIKGRSHGWLVIKEAGGFSWGITKGMNETGKQWGEKIKLWRAAYWRDKYVEREKLRGVRSRCVKVGIIRKEYKEKGKKQYTKVWKNIWNTLNRIDTDS